MYRNHFGLKAAPFSITPDTAFAFGSRAQKEALNTLLLAVGDDAGFIKITGEVGTGKTLTCRRFLAALAADPAKYATAYIPNPCLSPRTLLLAIAKELKLAVSPNAGLQELLAALNAHLLRAAETDLRVVVCLDEAQAMPRATFEALRLVSNLETEKRKLIQIVMFGQSELDRRLATPEMRQLASRISFQYTLAALSAHETESYLAHRLEIAGHSGPRLFDAAASRQVHAVSRGLPRLINIVAHKTLLLAFGAGQSRVSLKHIRAAAADTPFASRIGVPARLAAWRARSVATSLSHHGAGVVA
jgi:MSHA biogenesis protein MshM